MADVPQSLDARVRFAIAHKRLIEVRYHGEHPRGKHKARVFAAALGFSAENADELRAALLVAAAAANAHQAASDRFGTRYMLEFEIIGPRGAGIVKSNWIVRHGESTPRLTSCFVK